MNVSLLSLHQYCIINDSWLITATLEADLAGHFVAWLASPEAEFLRGKYLWVNWDVDELKARKEELSAPIRLITGLVGWA